MDLLSDLTLYYFDIGTTGRGENIHLFLQDAGIPHKYVRVGLDKWPAFLAELNKTGYPHNCLPAIELKNGKRYGMTAPTLRFMSKKLGKYLGSNEDDEQFLDAASDLANDWFYPFLKLIFSPEGLEDHMENVAPKHARRFELLYGKREGPYLLGEEISYVDFQVYHMLWDDKFLGRLDEYPNLKKFVAAFEERPNIKKYLATIPEEDKHKMLY